MSNENTSKTNNISDIDLLDFSLHNKYEIVKRLDDESGVIVRTKDGKFGVVYTSGVVFNMDEQKPCRVITKNKENKYFLPTGVDVTSMFDQADITFGFGEPKHGRR